MGESSEVDEEEEAFDDVDDDSPFNSIDDTRLLSVLRRLMLGGRSSAPPYSDQSMLRGSEKPSIVLHKAFSFSDKVVVNQKKRKRFIDLFPEIILARLASMDPRATRRRATNVKW